MVSSKKKLCTICSKKADQYVSAKEKAYGKELLAAIKKIIGDESLTLPSTFLICISCALALLQAEDIMNRLSLALAPIQTVKKGSKKLNVPAESMASDDAASQSNDSEHNSLIQTHSPIRGSLDTIMLNWQFKCHLCLHESEKPKIFKRHLLMKHQLDDPRIYKCPYCSESYQRSNGMQNHIAYVHEKRPKPMRQRRKTIDADAIDGVNAGPENATILDTSTEFEKKTEFTKTLELSNVEDKLKGSYTFKCDKCEYSHANAKIFKKHLMAKHNDNDVRIYKCGLCTNAYQRLHALQNHIAHVHENKPRPTPQRRKSVPPDFMREPADDADSTAKPEEDEIDTAEQNNGIQQCDYCDYETMDKFKLKKHVVLKHQIDSIAGDKQEREKYNNDSEKHNQEGNADDSLFKKPKNTDTLNGTANSKSSWMFRCEYCPYETSKKKLFRGHLYSEHNIENAEIYKCLDCGETYKRQHLLEIHFVHAHQKELPMYDDKSFASDSSLDITVTSEINTNEVREQKDTSMFNKNSTLSDTSFDLSAIQPMGKKHKLKHEKEPLMSSKNSTMLSDSSMNSLPIEKQQKLKHVKNLSASFNNSSVDDICVDLTASSPAKKQKLSKKNEICNLCGKAFSTLEKLRSHVDKNHEGDKLKYCGNCGAQFHSEEKYNAHVFAEKCLKAKIPCQYPGCSKRFSAISKLALHMQSKHPANNDDYEEYMD